MKGKKRGRKKKDTADDKNDKTSTNARTKRRLSVQQQQQKTSIAASDTQLSFDGVKNDGSQQWLQPSTEDTSTVNSQQQQQHQEQQRQELQKHLELLQQLNNFSPQISKELTSILFSTPDQWYINNTSIKNSLMSTHNMFDMGSAMSSAGLISSDACGSFGTGSSNNIDGVLSNEADISNYLMSSIIDTRNVRPSLASSIDSDIDLSTGLFNFDQNQSGILDATGSGQGVAQQQQQQQMYQQQSVIASDTSLLEALQPSQSLQPQQPQQQQPQQQPQIQIMKENEESEAEMTKRERKAAVSKEIRSLVADSFGLVQEVEMRERGDSSHRPISYIDYLNAEFPESLLIRKRISNSLGDTNDSESSASPAPSLSSTNTVPRQFTEDMYMSMQREIDRLRDVVVRKSNEVALLVAVNEQLRAKVVDIFSREETRNTKGADQVSDSSVCAVVRSPRSISPIEGSSSGSSNSGDSMKAASEEMEPVVCTDRKVSKSQSESASVETGFKELLSLMRSEKEMESPDFGIMLCFPGGRLVSVNRKLLTSLGYNHHDVFATLNRWEDIIAPSSYSTVIQGIITCLRQPSAARKSFRAEVQCRRKDNTTIGAELFTCLVGSKHGFIPIFAISYLLFKED